MSFTCIHQNTFKDLWSLFSSMSHISQHSTDSCFLRWVRCRHLDQPSCASLWIFDSFVAEASTKSLLTHYIVKIRMYVYWRLSCDVTALPLCLINTSSCKAFFLTWGYFCSIIHGSGIKTVDAMASPFQHHVQPASGQWRDTQQGASLGHPHI